MRVPIAAFLVALLALPVLPAHGSELTAPVPRSAPAGTVPLSHQFFTPYQHLAALEIQPGIRPGAWLQIGGANCTSSFVLRDKGGALYILTAGHCTEVGHRASITEDAPVAAQAPQRDFGTVVANWPLGYDAGLVAIDRARYGDVNPTMTGWGGPTGLLTGSLAQDTQTLHHGWGWVTWYDLQTRCRRGVAAPEYSDADVWWTHEVGGGGDSGSAIMTSDGQALGILDWGGGDVIPTVVTTAFVSDMVGGVRLDAVLRAFHATGWDLELVLGKAPVQPACTPEV